MVERVDPQLARTETQLGAVRHRGLAGAPIHAGDTALFEDTIPGSEPVDILRGADAGDLVAGAFELVRPIGEGGMGTVWLGRDLTLDRQVAIKLMRIDGRNARQRKRLLLLLEREARATARLKHPNVVTIHQVGTWRGSPYLVLELLDGQPLDARIADGKLPIAEALQILIEVLRALVHAHSAGLIHRDIKPQNVFLTADSVVKVLDFGLAQMDVTTITGRKLQRDSTVIAGSPAYMAPEQVRGAALDGRTDLWACGVMLFQLLTGDLPFQRLSQITDKRLAPTLRTLDADLPAVLERVVARCLAKEPAARYPNAAALLRELEDVKEALGGERVAEGEPFRYLRAFQEEEEAWFFGREAETAALHHRLVAQPLTALIGASGAGKTSLVHAGLLPRLRRAGEAWSVIALRPGRTPMVTLARRLEDQCSERAMAMAGGTLAARPGATGRVLRAHARESGTRVLLWVDQLEQLLSPDVSAVEREGFAAALLHAAEDSSAPVRVLLNLREEALPRFVACRPLHDAMVSQAMPLGRPDEAALTRCLVTPAERAGFCFEPELLGELLRGLAEQASPLPMLQFTAGHLWARRDEAERCLTRAALTELGGFDGLFAEQAEAVYHTFVTELERGILREVMCALVSADGRRLQKMRAPLTRRSEDPDRAGQVIGRLIAGRLLTASAGGSGELLELTHDALIRRWPRMVAWLNDDVELRLFRARLEQAAADWAQQGRPRGGLWLGDAWAPARRLLARLRGELSAEEQAFVQRAAQVDQRSRWLRRGLLFAVVLTAVGVAGVSIAAVRSFRAVAADAVASEGAARRSAALARRAQGEAQAETDLAEQARRRGIANVLAASSVAGLAHTPKDSLRLAHRAVKTRSTSAAMTALHGALNASAERRVLRHGDQPLVAVRQLPSGRVVTFDEGGGVRVWLSGGRALRSYPGRGASVVATAVPPSASHAGGAAAAHAAHATGAAHGPALAILRADGDTLLLDAAGVVITRWQTHRRQASGLAFDGGGQHLVMIDRLGGVEIWSAALRAAGPVGVPRRLRAVSLEGAARVVVWMPALTGWVVGLASGRLVVIPGSSAQLDRPPKFARGHHGAVLALAVTPDGQTLLSAGKDGTVRRWRADGSSTVLGRHGGWVTALAVSADGQVVATGSTDETAAIWRLSGGLVHRLKGHEYGLAAVRFSPDGRCVLTASLDGTARIWTLSGSLRAIFQGHERPLVDGRWSADGRHVITASEDGSARIWRTTGEELWTSVGPRCVLGSAVMSPDGSRLLTWPVGDLFEGCPPGSPPRLWRLPADDSPPNLSSSARHPEEAGQGEAIAELASAVAAASLDDQGGVLALASGELVRIDVAGHVVHQVLAHPGGVVTLRRRPGDGAFLTTGMDGTVALWTADLRLRWQHHVGTAALAFCGRQDVLVGGAGLTRYGPTGAVLARLGVAPGLSALACDDAGSLVWMGTEDGSLWRMAADLSGRRRLVGHHGRISALVVLPTGLVSGSQDGTVRFWTREGALLASVDHGDPVVAVRAHPVPGAPAETLIVTASATGALRLLAADGALRADLSGHGATAAARASSVIGIGQDLDRQHDFGALQVSADGRRLLVARLDEDVRVRWLRADDLLAAAARRLTPAP